MPRGWQRYVPYALLASAVLIAYSNVFENQFLFDDDLLIRLNTYLRSWDTFGHLFTASTTEGAHIAGGFYRPVQNLLYFFIFQIGGEKPLGFHILNVALQAANACLGYRLALRLGFDPRAALFAMLVWAVHPLHTEAITYMSGTADPLFVFFCLWALNILFPQPTLRQVWKCLPLFTLALLSKETAVVFPALAMVCLFYVSNEKLKPKTYFVTWPLWLIAIAYLSWRVNCDYFDGPARYVHLFTLPEYRTLKMYVADPVMRLYTFFATLPAYAQLLVWPVGLHMERSFALYNMIGPAVAVGMFMMLAALLQIGFARGKYGFPIGWGLLWFGVAHFPNSGIFFSMNSIFLEHWMYLPSLGLFLGLSQSAVLFLDRYINLTLDYLAIGVALGVILFFAILTYNQNTVWREPLVFYNNIFAYGVISPRAHNNLAIAYVEHHDPAKAIQEYRRAIKEGDTYAETHYNLALVLLNSAKDDSSQVQAAVAELQRSLEIEPRFYRSYMALATVYAHRGDKAKAADYQHKGEDILNH